jgi:hypothetical protein
MTVPARIARRVAPFSAVVALVGCGATQGPTAAPITSPPPAAITIHADHPGYPDAAALREAAELIVTGVVLSHTVDPGRSEGTDGNGEPLPAIPYTTYLVGADNVLKGAVPSGPLQVKLMGGDTAEGFMAVDGASALTDGDRHLFFLTDRGDGTWAPLAAGAAIGTGNPDGTWAFPASVAGSDRALVVTESDIDPQPPAATATPQPSTGPAPQPPVGPGDRTAPKLRLSVPAKQKLAVVLKRGLKLRVGCDEACRSQVTLRLDGKAAKAHRLTKRRVVTTVATGNTAKAGIVTVKFTARARKALKRVKRLKLTVNAQAFDALGNRAGVKRTVTITRKSAKLSR